MHSRYPRSRTLTRVIWASYLKINSHSALSAFQMDRPHINLRTYKVIFSLTANGFIEQTSYTTSLGGPRSDDMMKWACGMHWIFTNFGHLWCCHQIGLPLENHAHIWACTSIRMATGVDRWKVSWHEHGCLSNGVCTTSGILWTRL